MVIGCGVSLIYSIEIHPKCSNRHSPNLSLWGRATVSSDCKLCGQQQTLLHVLNHCPVALELRRFNHRHDAVLTVIASFVRAHLAPSQEAIVDLPGEHYKYPQHIGVMDSRPDIVVWEENIKSVYLIELTVCFETNFDEARHRKICRYTELCEEAEDRGYTCSILTIEVGSRGVLNIAGIEKLRGLLHVGKKQWTSFLINLSKTAMVESHRIWSARNWRGQSENIHVP